MELKLPANWQEIIDAGLYRPVIGVLNMQHESSEHACVAMLQVLGVDYLAIANAQPLGDISLHDIELAFEMKQYVFPMLDFIFEREAFYNNPIPVFEHQGIKYYGPEERLMNQTGAEWSICHHAQTMLATCKPDFARKHIVAIVAVNYRRKVKKDLPGLIQGERVPFDEHTLEKRIGLFASLDDETLMGIYLWYVHCNYYWQNKLAELYGEGPQRIKPSGKEIWSLVFQLAGNKMGDDYTALKSRTRQEIVLALEELHRQEIERELNKKG